VTRWQDETFQGRVRFGLPVRRTLLATRSEFQAIDIVETELGPTLLLDGAYMASVVEEFFYHEMLVHPALTVARRIGRVLVIGGGDGGTVREVLRYREVERVVMCELDAMVVSACREHMTAMAVPWDDPRLELHFGDGVAFLRDYAGPPWDVILVDGPDPVGPAEGLFERSFYATCRAHLAPGGVLATQSEAPFLMRDDFVRIVHGMRGVFSRVHPYFAPVLIYPGGSWSWTFASDAVEPLAPREPRLHEIEGGCRYYNREIHRAAFAVPTYLRQALAAL